MKFLACNKILYILIICHSLAYLTLSICYSQNLVPNPSFENNVDFNLQSPENWIRCLKNDTPDYFNTERSSISEFNNSLFFGGASPYEGSACIGIFCYRENPLRGISDIREFIQIELSEPLKRDSIYDISLFISLDKESNHAINYFHVYFSEEVIHERHERKMFSKRPQIVFRKNFLESSDWVKLEDT